jgi:hypothetical protein
MSYVTKAGTKVRLTKAGLGLALIVAAGTAQAQTTIITREPAPPATVGAVVTTERLQLSPVQRQTIYRTVTKERVAPAQATVEYRVGMRVPEATTLYEVPPTVIAEVPSVRSYKYMVVNNRVWLVDPATSEVVAEIDN